MRPIWSGRKNKDCDVNTKSAQSRATYKETIRKHGSGGCMANERCFSPSKGGVVAASQDYGEGQITDKSKVKFDLHDITL